MTYAVWKYEEERRKYVDPTACRLKCKKYVQVNNGVDETEGGGYRRKQIMQEKL